MPSNSRDNRAKFGSGDPHPARHDRKPLLPHPTRSSNDAQATSVISILQRDLLESLKQEVLTIVGTALEGNPEPPIVRDRTWKLEVRSKAFGTTVNSLQRAYAKMLHEVIDDERSFEVAANVRNLASAVAWKLEVNCPKHAEEGMRLMEEMLSHFDDEFCWVKIVAILEGAAKVARTKKAESYLDALACQEQLREIRRTGPPDSPREPQTNKKQRREMRGTSP